MPAITQRRVARGRQADHVADDAIAGGCVLIARAREESLDGAIGFRLNEDLAASHKRDTDPVIAGHQVAQAGRRTSDKIVRRVANEDAAELVGPPLRAGLIRADPIPLDGDVADGKARPAVDDDTVAAEVTNHQAAYPGIAGGDDQAAFAARQVFARQFDRRGRGGTGAVLTPAIQDDGVCDRWEGGGEHDRRWLGEVEPDRILTFIGISQMNRFAQGKDAMPRISAIEKGRDGENSGRQPRLDFLEPRGAPSGDGAR